MYALILAGGIGTRMWPKSRQAIPKQFLDLTGEETMLQTTIRRIAPLIPLEKTFIVTGQRYVDLVQQQLPDLPPQNIVAEICGKNTAPAIGLGAMHIQQQDPDATMAVLTADHIIPNEAAFRQALIAADAVAQTGRLVTLGITPTDPNTGYGYIHRAESLGEFAGEMVYRVGQFLEKPDLPAAKTFFESSEYYWNSGMFIWQASTFFSQCDQHMAAMVEKLQDIRRVLFDENRPEAVEAIWNDIQPESIDVGLMEKAENVAVVPLDAGWTDVGSWSALYDELAETPGENIAINAEHLSLDTDGVLIQGCGKLVATIGVENLVIVQTDDALLICDKNRTQDIKKIVNRLKTDQRNEYL